MSFGKMLQHARKSRHLTLIKLSELCGVHYTQLSNIERGAVAPPRASAIMRIAQALSIDPKPLLEEVILESDNVSISTMTDAQKKFALAALKITACSESSILKATKYLSELLSTEQL